jgi:hypothetical protein
MMIAAVAAAASLFILLGALSWRTKYGPGRTVTAVVAIDTIVLHQRVTGQGIRGPVAEDRLVSIDGRTGDEYARKTVLRGELVGVQNEKVVYSIGTRLVMYDARTLETSPSPEALRLPPLTRFGAMTDLGDAILMLDTMPERVRARASRLSKQSHAVEWTCELPWIGHDTKLVTQLGGNVVIVDADGAAAIGRTRGDLAWLR